MITIRLKGGLGNQMFQYALGVRLGHDLKTSLDLDLSSLLDRSKGDFVYRNYDLSIFDAKPEFSINPTVIELLSKLKSSRVTKLLGSRVKKNRPYVKEKYFHYQPEIILNANEDAVYEGWFQSSKYFDGVEDILRKQFSFKASILEESQSILERIGSTQSVCLNVRRTDFVKTANLNTTNKSYFENSVDRIISEIGEATFFVFSDDIQWCRENIIMNHDMYIVDHGHAGYKFSNYLNLMSKCDHFIIPNSSFAWWAVWLRNSIESKVIAPANWFADDSIDTSDLIPESWIRV